MSARGEDALRRRVEKIEEALHGRGGHDMPSNPFGKGKYDAKLHPKNRKGEWRETFTTHPEVKGKGLGGPPASGAKPKPAAKPKAVPKPAAKKGFAAATPAPKPPPKNFSADVDPDLAASPARSSAGRLRNFSAMSDEKLLKTHADQKAHNSTHEDGALYDADAQMAVEHELATRGLKPGASKPAEKPAPSSPSTQKGKDHELYFGKPVSGQKGAKPAAAKPKPKNVKGAVWPDEEQANAAGETIKGKPLDYKKVETPALQKMLEKATALRLDDDDESEREWETPNELAMMAELEKRPDAKPTDGSAKPGEDKWADQMGSADEAFLKKHGIDAEGNPLPKGEGGKAAPGTPGGPAIGSKEHQDWLAAKPEAEHGDFRDPWHNTGYTAEEYGQAKASTDKFYKGWTQKLSEGPDDMAISPSTGGPKISKFGGKYYVESHDNIDANLESWKQGKPPLMAGKYSSWQKASQAASDMDMKLRMDDRREERQKMGIKPDADTLDAKSGKAIDPNTGEVIPDGGPVPVKDEKPAPTEDVGAEGAPAKEKPKAKGKGVVLDKPPPGGWTDADKVPKPGEAKSEGGAPGDDDAEIAKLTKWLGGEMPSGADKGLVKKRLAELQAKKGAAAPEEKIPGATAIVNGKAGRWVKLNGKMVHVKHHEDMSRKEGNDTFTSPAGTTAVYKNDSPYSAPKGVPHPKNAEPFPTGAQGSKPVKPAGDAEKATEKLANAQGGKLPSSPGEKHPDWADGEGGPVKPAGGGGGQPPGAGETLKPELNSPGRSSAGRLRNFHAMSDEKLAKTLNDLTAHGNDPEAVSAAQAEAKTRVSAQPKPAAPKAEAPSAPAASSAGGPDLSGLSDEDLQTAITANDQLMQAQAGNPAVLKILKAHQANFMAEFQKRDAGGAPAAGGEKTASVGDFDAAWEEAGSKGLTGKAQMDYARQKAFGTLGDPAAGPDEGTTGGTADNPSVEVDGETVSADDLIGTAQDEWHDDPEAGGDGEGEYHEFLADHVAGQLENMRDDGLIDSSQFATMHDAAMEKLAKLDPPAQPDNSGPIPNYDHVSLTVKGGAGGSTGAKIATAGDGTKYLQKTYQGNQDRVATELAANAIYRELGAKVPEAGIQHAGDGKPTLVYPLLDGEPHKIHGPSAAIGQHFMADALVANWDFIGLVDDNILWDKDGVPFRVDQGGTLGFRAQGAPKQFGPVPSEVWSMMTGGGQGVGKVKVTYGEKKEQAAKIADTLTPAKIDAIMDAAPFANQQMRDENRQALKDRVAWMGRYAQGLESDPSEGYEAPPPGYTPEAFAHEKATAPAAPVDLTKALQDELAAAGQQAAPAKPVTPQVPALAGMSPLGLPSQGSALPPGWEGIPQTSTYDGTGRSPSGGMRNFGSMSDGKLQATYSAVAAEKNDPDAMKALTFQMQQRGLLGAQAGVVATPPPAPAAPKPSTTSSGATLRPELNSPARSSAGRLRNFGAMNNGKLIVTYHDTLDHGNDPEALTRIKAEMATRGLQEAALGLEEAFGMFRANLHPRDRAGKWTGKGGRHDFHVNGLRVGNVAQQADGSWHAEHGGLRIVGKGRKGKGLAAYVPVRFKTADDAKKAVENRHARSAVKEATVDTPDAAMARRVARRMELIEAADSLRKASTPEPFSKSKTSNWVAKGGGLPAYIQHVAHALVEQGKSESKAIAMAIGIVKRWARGGGNVDAGTKAAATKALGEWEALKAKAHAK